MMFIDDMELTILKSSICKSITGNLAVFNKGTKRYESRHGWAIEARDAGVAMVMSGRSWELTFMFDHITESGKYIILSSQSCGRTTLLMSRSEKRPL